MIVEKGRTKFIAIKLYKYYNSIGLIGGKIMPSLVMYLAIAKKYMEKHPEENEEEFIEGILAPDRKRNLRVEKDRLHYGESSHRPDLNRYCQDEGLESSYNRGYFLNLLTDYLFYNRYLQEYSADIFYDFKRMNKRIEDKYDVHVPEGLESRVRYKDGDLKSVDEESVYKFIDTVGSLDLEQYREHTDKQDEKHKLKMIGLKAGLLFKQNVVSPNSPLNQLNEAYFYGFENNYGVLIQRIIGYAETDGARKGLYQVSPVGIAVKPSKIMELKGTDIATIRERLLPDEREFVFKACEEGLGKSIRKDIGFNFQEMSKEDIKVLLKTIKDLPERTPKKEVTDRGLNSDLMKEDDIEIE